MLRSLCIIGVGLIGGSLARAARGAGLCAEIVGSGRNAANLQRAVELGVIDRYHTDPAVAVRGADLVVAAVPLGAMETVLRQIAPALAEDAVVTDVGSAKASVVAAARAALGDHARYFVPGHPIAGTERSGVEASFADLYQGRKVILTPVAETDPAATAKVRAVWAAVGAEVMEMAVAHHDEVLAATSHLPHVLAYALVDTLSRMGESEEIFQYAAGGFRDFTRIASSDPVMWRDICLANRDALLGVIERYEADLRGLADAIRAGDGEQLLEVFARAKSARDRHCER
ncbi:MAG: prephenate dehydrogenase/arogenate dehydrogenase family protein [Gammaproteobacteria bacterium]